MERCSSQFSIRRIPNPQTNIPERKNLTSRLSTDHMPFARHVSPQARPISDRRVLPTCIQLRAHHWQLRRLPRRKPAGQLDQVGDAVLIENPDRNRRPVAARAMHRDPAVCGSCPRSPCRWASGRFTLSPMRFWLHSRVERISTTSGGFDEASSSSSIGALTLSVVRHQVGSAGQRSHPIFQISVDAVEADPPSRIAASCSRPGSAMITIGRAASSTVPAQVAY